MDDVQKSYVKPAASNAAPFSKDKCPKRVPEHNHTWSHRTYLSAQIDVQKRPEEPSRSRSEFKEV